MNKKIDIIALDQDKNLVEIIFRQHRIVFGIAAINAPDPHTVNIDINKLVTVVLIIYVYMINLYQAPRKIISGSR